MNDRFQGIYRAHRVHYRGFIDDFVGSKITIEEGSFIDYDLWGMFRAHRVVMIEG